MIKRLPTMWKTQVRSLGQEDPLKKEMAIHWRLDEDDWRSLWTEEPGRLHTVHRVAKQPAYLVTEQLIHMMTYKMLSQ